METLESVAKTWKRVLRNGRWVWQKRRGSLQNGFWAVSRDGSETALLSAKCPAVHHKGRFFATAAADERLRAVLPETYLTYAEYAAAAAAPPSAPDEPTAPARGPTKDTSE